MTDHLFEIARQAFMTEANPRPNFIIFFSDQQRHDTTGVHGCPLDLTPNFDHWARRGTHVATMITPQPVCGPARACLQTGRFATAIGDGCHTNARPLPTDADTLAKRLAAAGYETGYFDEWHLGPHDAIGPVDAASRGGWRRPYSVSFSACSSQSPRSP